MEATATTGGILIVVSFDVHQPPTMIDAFFNRGLISGLLMFCKTLTLNQINYRKPKHPIQSKRESRDPIFTTTPSSSHRLLLLRNG